MARMTAEERAEAKRKKLRDFFSHIKREYGLTETEYRALYAAQGGRCFACRRAKGRGRLLGVDHNHLTGEVRALVCTGSRDPKTCNRLIAFYTRAQLLRAAAILSDPPPARAVLAALRSGETDIPSLVDPGTYFDIREVRGVVLHPVQDRACRRWAELQHLGQRVGDQSNLPIVGGPIGEQSGAGAVAEREQPLPPENRAGLAASSSPPVVFFSAASIITRSRCSIARGSGVRQIPLMHVS